MEIGFYQGRALEPFACPEDDDADDHECRGADDEETDLEVVGLLSHKYSEAYAVACACRLKNCRTHGFSERSRNSCGLPSAMMPCVRLSSMITRSAIVSMLGSSCVTTTN